MEAYERAGNDNARTISEDLVLQLIRAGAKLDIENCNGDKPEVPQCILERAMDQVNSEPSEVMECLSGKM